MAFEIVLNTSCTMIWLQTLWGVECGCLNENVAPAHTDSYIRMSGALVGGIIWEGLGGASLRVVFEVSSVFLPYACASDI